MEYVFLMMILILATSGRPAHAATYNVGDNAGWVVPSNGATTYSDWAKNFTFFVGDVLVFKFAAGHTVATVNKNAYDSCTPGSPLRLESSSPATVTLNSTGEHYFICTLHCTFGQKLTVNVSSAAKGSPPSSSPKSSPSPGSNSSSPSPLAAGGSPPLSSNPASPPPPPPSSATRATIFSSILFLPFLLAIL